MATPSHAATNTRRYDLYDLQVMPPPLTIDLPPEEESEYIGNRPQEEIIGLLQEGVSLSLRLETEKKEYCIEAKGKQVIFEEWHLDGDRISAQPYDSLDLLLQSEQSRPSFDLSAFELIC